MSAGWHPDPLGRYAQRYHDGAKWTSNVSNTGGVTEEDPMGTAPSQGGMPTAPPVSPSEMQAPTGPGGFRALPGNPFLRFIARIIDGLLIGLPLWLLLNATMDINMDFSDAESIEFPVAAYVIQIAVFAVYEIYMIGQFGRTIGKMATGLTVVRKNDCALPGFGVATVRYIANILYVIPILGFFLFIATVIMGFSGALRQTIHDKVASTVVAKTSSL